ncbi:MAG: WXG100 family type VII secretion target [Bifidobacteriaceae bacterium]|jgi:WXG100 family type VII secretion target|nr:WXG100 family type VII secretion target [Bifidobacteriaceae bacterium]
MSTYQVNAEQLATASSSVHLSIGNIQSEVAKLMGQLRGLESSWSGAAHNAFAAVANQWETTQKQVETALNNINQALAAAGTAYSTAEDSALKMFAAG